jgi:ATP-dependent Clp protease adaptor protein ClpS
MSTRADPTLRTRPATRPRTRPPRRLPPYAVVVLNDDEHTFAYVIETLQRVFGYGWTRALLLTVKIHTFGRAAVWTGPLEVAEFKRERIIGFGPDVSALGRVDFPLGCVIEPLA